MNTDSLPRFVLEPWEFAGAPHSPLADAVTRCEWNEKTVSMRLKVRENLLFFAPEGSNEALFACAEPLADSISRARRWAFRPNRLERWFRLALENDWWARVVQLSPRLEPNQADKTSILALVKSDGVGWLRRLYENESHPFWVDWPAGDVHLRGDFAHWPTEPLTRHLSLTLEPRQKEVAELTISQSARERGKIPMTWLRGDQQQLSLLVEKSLVLFQDFDLLKRHDGSPGAAGCQISCATVIKPESLQIWFAWSVDKSSEVRNLFSLYRRLHLAVGQTLDYYGNVQPMKWHVSAQCPDSAHERLEAMMQLRDAVRGTAIEGEVGEILQRVS